MEDDIINHRSIRQLIYKSEILHCSIEDLNIKQNLLPPNMFSLATDIYFGLFKKTVLVDMPPQ